MNNDGITHNVNYMERREINERYILEKKNVPCEDCGLRWHPAVITFDHIDRKGKYVSGSGKRMNPNKMLTYNPTDFKNMIDACGAVCMNCHRIREMYRDKVLLHSKWLPWWKQLSKGALLIDTNSRDVNS